ncbi:hypothetical protein Aoki45_27270 [Algoriphagus sp. oki45]|uniref:DUF4221 family protein n=1 Tax=Algoriphagus sp. oki45 TaxID=3067294 RepID=UPI0027FFB777|nr:hypothetical protein Aoki45_27270 [Algoriphagus sp. oki45]
MKNLSILIGIFCLASCSQVKEHSTDPLSYVSDTTVISIDRKTENYVRAVQHFDGKLYWWNSNRSTISVIDLESQQVEKTIKLAEEGPDGLGIALGIFVINSDSLIIPNMSYELNLINSQGSKLAKFDYSEFSKIGVVIPSMTRYSSMIQTNKKGRLFFGMEDLKNLPLEDIDEKALTEYPPILTLDLDKGTFEFLEFKVPNSILKYNNFINFGIAANSTGILLLHNHSNMLLEVDFSGKSYKEHELKSDLITNFSNAYFLSPRMSSSIEKNMKLAFKYSDNFGLEFDPHKNLLYRFGWPGEEIPEGVNVDQFNSTPPFYTLSVYDGSDFSLIKEFTLPRNTYLAHHYFVDEKGLNLFPMHPDNPEFNEDELVIHTFDFSGLK